jgi:hypothetical protein
VQGIYFFTVKTTFMTIYLIQQENELHIFQVLPEQEDRFQQKYGQQILVSGDNIQDVLRKFNEMPVIFCNGV